MTTYSEQNDTVHADDETQVHRIEPDGQRHAFEPPVASDDYPAEVLQRKRFGGANWGAGFFGWLVVVAMSVLLTAAATAAVVVLDRTGDVLPAGADGSTDAGIWVAAVVLGILVVSSFSGGYVAGRMSRFDGGRQGVVVWVVGLLLTGAAVGLALVFGPQVDLPDRADLSAWQLPTSATGLTAVAAVVVALVVSLVAAVLGGKVGCRYHRKVDDAAYV
jgi:hypothetical protein